MGTIATSNLFASAEEGLDYYAIHGSMNYFAIKQNAGYKLYCRREEKYISEREYDTICGYYAYSGCENGVVVVCIGGKFGLIDAENGKEVLSPSDSPITDFEDGIYAPEPLIWNIGGKRETLTSMPIYSEARWGYRSDLNPVIYYYTWNFKTYEFGTMRFGFSDKDGKEVIPPLYDRAGSFLNNVAIVVNGLKYGAINAGGKQIVPFDYDMIEYPYHGNLMKVFKVQDDYKNGELFTPDNIGFAGSLCGIIDCNGKIIIPCEYGDISNDNFGRYILRNQQLAGMADDNKNIIIPVIYEDVYSTINPEYIIIKQKGKCGMVTPHHKVLIRPNKFEDIYLVLEHGKIFFFAMKDGKWGHISRTGKILLALKYDSIEPYLDEDDNSFIVNINEQWMRINSKGDEIERYEKHPYEIIDVSPVDYYSPAQ